MAMYETDKVVIAILEDRRKVLERELKSDPYNRRARHELRKVELGLALERMEIEEKGRGGVDGSAESGNTERGSDE